MSEGKTYHWEPGQSAPPPGWRAVELNAKSRAQLLIAEECDDLKTMLLEKNLKYGNSALEPKRIFSRAEAREQIRVRIDDKLSRIGCDGGGFEDEDVVLDLIGYLILLRVAEKMNS